MRPREHRSRHWRRLSGAFAVVALLVAAAVCAVAAPSAGAAPLPTTLTVTADPAALASGDTATLTIQVSVPNAALSLSAKTLGEPGFTLVTALVADGDGAVTHEVQPARSTTYRVEFAGDGSASAAQADVAVAVHPGLTFTATPANVRWDSSTTLRAVFGLPAAPLTLSRRIAGEPDFTVLETITTGADGAYSLPLAQRHTTTTYRLEYAGDDEWAPVTADAIVAVRPRVSLTVSSASVYEGWKVAFKGSVTPAHPGAQVVLEKLTSEGWKAMRTVTLASDSSFTYRWTSVGRGKKEFRVAMAADAEHAWGSSTRRSVTLKNPNPYGVPANQPRTIVVDKSQYKLFYHEYGRIVRVFPCVLGKPSTPTPLGRFRIYAMDRHMWGAYGPRRMRYKGLFAIHGTNEPWLLSRFPRAYSHGCTRLSNTNVLWLFDHCRVGTPIWNVR